MIDCELVNAFFPPRTQVLQVQLLPFSLGHLLTLEKIESPFICGESFRVLDLFAAVRVCSLTWEECQQFVECTEEYADQFREWVAKVGEVDFVEKGKLFGEYLERGKRYPDFKTEERDGVGGETWTPIEQRMRVRLIRDLGLTESEVMNRPLALCWWDFMTLEEEKGNCSILTGEAKDAENAAWEEHERLCQSLR